MDLLLLALFLSGSLYCIAVLWLWWGLGRSGPELTQVQPMVSVIVAARDEESVLSRCLQALESQDYSGCYEVVVVDDRSQDDTWNIIAAKAKTWPGLKGLKAASQLRFTCPKKSALAQGIEASSGSILLFTDADCCPPIGWVASMAAHFASGVGLVAGYAHPDPVRGLMGRLLAVDNIAVGALAAGSFAMGKPLSCSGRNLAYRREVYDKVGGFAQIGHLIGGDDVYFMRLVAAAGRWKMVFNRAVPMPSGPTPARIGDVVQQKLRHAAKGGHYEGGAFLLAVALYCFHFFLAWALLRMFLGSGVDGWVLGAWFLRWCIDTMLLWRMAALAERWLLRYLPLVEVVYIPYVLIFTVVGRLGWFRWKS